jgi:beta-glucosidase-like glycosyl hydrolase
VERVGLPSYAYLLEANTAVAAVCLGAEQCATVFHGPNGLAASFNRSLWHRKGQVLSTEVRAFQNHGGKRGLGKPTGLAVFGPNINLASSEPRFGRNSELPGEDPYLAGEYAVQMVTGMQERDSAGHPRSIAYLKHFLAYRREQDRGHDTYNLSAYDLADTYLPMYHAGLTTGGASGLMCSYNAENGVPSCANGALLNGVVRQQWGRTDAVVTTDSGAIANLRESRWEVDDEGEVSDLLGVEFIYGERSVMLHQAAYIARLVAEFG